MAIKGINKQIIEIKCTNNEYFDKVLLFVKGNTGCVQNEYLMAKGKDLVRNVTESAKNNYEIANSKRKRKAGLAVTISVITAVILTVLAVYCVIG